MPPKPKLDRSRYILHERSPGEFRLSSAPSKWIAAIFDGHPPFHTLSLSFIQGRDFSGLAGLTFLEAIYAYPWKHPDFEPLRPLTRLRLAHLNIYGKASDLSAFSNLQKLEELRILPGSTSHDLAPLAHCRALRSIQFENVTPEDSPTFRGLAALRGMTWLEELFLSGPLTDDDLTAAARMTWLKHLAFADTEPVERYGWLAAQMPTTDSYLFHPWVEIPINCSRCGAAEVRLTGQARPKLICPACRPKPVRAHEERFNAAKAAATPTPP